MTLLVLFKITKAALTLRNDRKKVIIWKIKKKLRPFSMPDRGGKNIDKEDLKTDIQIKIKSKIQILTAQ